MEKTTNRLMRWRHRQGPGREPSCEPHERLRMIPFGRCQLDVEVWEEMRIHSIVYPRGMRCPQVLFNPVDFEVHYKVCAVRSGLCVVEPPEPASKKGMSERPKAPHRRESVLKLETGIDFPVMTAVMLGSNVMERD